MRYTVLKGCVAGGSARRAGSIIELDEKEAESLMLMGRVAPHDEGAAREDRSIGLREETKPRRRRTKKAES